MRIPICSKNTVLMLKRCAVFLRSQLSYSRNSGRIVYLCYFLLAPSLSPSLFLPCSLFWILYIPCLANEYEGNGTRWIFEQFCSSTWKTEISHYFDYKHRWLKEIHEPSFFIFPFFTTRMHFIAPQMQRATDTNVWYQNRAASKTLCSAVCRVAL